MVSFRLQILRGENESNSNQAIENFMVKIYLHTIDDFLTLVRKQTWALIIWRTSCNFEVHAIISFLL